MRITTVIPRILFVKNLCEDDKCSRVATTMFEMHESQAASAIEPRKIRLSQDRASWRGSSVQPLPPDALEAPWRMAGRLSGVTTMAGNMPDDGSAGYTAREAVGVFDNADTLEAAVDQLEISGFKRAAISVLASDKIVKSRLGRLYSSVNEIVDDPRGPLVARSPRPLWLRSPSGALELELVVC